MENISTVKLENLSEDKPKIDEMCRLCHVHLNSENSVDIFEDESSASLSVPLKIKLFVGIETSPMDLMPKKLCSGCRLHLEKCTLARIKAKNLESKMRKHVRLISAGRVSHVFDDDDDEEIDDECAESMEFIESMTRQLGADENNNGSNQIDLEVEKKRIYDEIVAKELAASKADAEEKLEEMRRAHEEQLANARLSLEEELIAQRRNFDAKLGRSGDETAIKLHEAEKDLEEQKAKLQSLTEKCEKLEEELYNIELDETTRTKTLEKDLQTEREYIVAMTAAHQDEIKRLTEEAAQKLLAACQKDPSPKRKRVSDGHSADGMPCDTSIEKIEDDENETDHPCRACSKNIRDNVLGFFRKEIEGKEWNFCSESCMDFIIEVFSESESMASDIVKPSNNTATGASVMVHSGENSDSVLVSTSTVAGCNAKKIDENGNGNHRDDDLEDVAVAAPPKVTPQPKILNSLLCESEPKTFKGEHFTITSNGNVTSTTAHKPSSQFGSLTVTPGTSAPKPVKPTPVPCLGCKRFVPEDDGISVEANGKSQRYCSGPCFARTTAQKPARARQPSIPSVERNQPPAITRVPVAKPPVNTKQCQTCKKLVVNGLVAEKEDGMYHFCNHACFNRFVSDARFHCEYCSTSYKAKFSLKIHVLNTHPGRSFNPNIKATHNQ